MLVHTLRRARNDTEITGLAPSARLLRLASPSQGGEVYTNGREWESGGAIKNWGMASVAGPQAWEGRRRAVLSVAARWNPANRDSDGILIVLAMAAPAFGPTVFIVVFSVLGVQGFGGGRYLGGRYLSDRLNRLRRGCALLVCQRRRKVQQAERDQSAHERSQEHDLLTDPRQVTRYPYTVHVHCPTIFDGQILLAWQRVGAPERSTLQVPDAFANRPGASVCDADCRTAQHPTAWLL
jgi:hypothetical protein